MRNHSFASVTLIAAVLLSGACATNPATGKRQLSLIGEAKEIEMGRNADEQFAQQLGLYPDDELQAYVQALGEQLAAESERPHLPWTFRVVDDPVVNAFALPGGFIYITRGILAHLSSEAELVGVLGHEIGHVTARHSVNQMSKAQLAQIGLIAGTIAAPRYAQGLGGLAQQGLGMLFLKFGRDDERQADGLGFRYMSRTGHPPAALPEVFGVLGSVSAQANGGSRLPNFLSTHPAPEDRQARANAMLRDLPPELANASWRAEPYLAKIDDIVYGEDPRQGFFRGNTFYHPELALRVTFPEGWKTQNQRQAVIAVSPEQDAMLQLSLVAGDDPEAAASEFFRSNPSLESAGNWLRNNNGLRTASDAFQRVDESNAVQLRGGAAFTAYGGRVYKLVAATKPDRWGQQRHTLERAVASFGPERDRRILDVEPRTLSVVRIPRAMTLRTFQDQYPSSISIEALAVLNHAEPDTEFAAGSRVKRVLGRDPSAE